MQMKNLARQLLLTIVAIAVLALGHTETSAQNLKEKGVFSIVTCPGENSDNQMNISFGTDTGVIVKSIRLYKVKRKNAVKKAQRKYSNLLKEIRTITVDNSDRRLCNVFDSIYSKAADGSNFYEKAVFHKFDINIDGLKKNTEYAYIIDAERASGEKNEAGEFLRKDIRTPVHYFKTSGSKKWNACVISDYHCYPPLGGRLAAAMRMVDTINAYKPIDWVLSLGDLCAWGGSYSFWTGMYEEPQFERYMWSELNGNHDNMTRQYRLSNEFFRNATANPYNGYEGEMGVCYWFKYNDALFIILNNESMRDSAGLEKARDWAEGVLKSVPARYRIVCEHYQWFYGTEGQTSQYERWHDIFDRYKVDLALGANNHIYVRSYALKDGKATDGRSGTVYIQTPSCDNERGQQPYKALKENQDKIAFRWNEGPKTVGAMHMEVNPKSLTLRLMDRTGNVVDSVVIPSKQKSGI